MKQSMLSTCEKSFVSRAIAEGKRLDGRRMDESRMMHIYFGTDWGCCQVSLGETKVLAQVSCEVQQPKATRPNEGLLFLNIELSPMGSPDFEVGRQSELAVQLNRLLEKCIKDSQCVDLESLCIVAEEKVWALRVDINVLNHEGNLVAAASAAALTALSHFRCPSVTITGEETIIHDPSEKDPIPLNLRHYPVCVSYAIFNKGEHVVVDPTVIEERVSETQVVFGVNAYRELCGLHLGGSSLTSRDLILRCANRAATRAGEVVQIMKSALKEDADSRAAGKSVRFADCIEEGRLLALSTQQLSLQLDSTQLRGEALKLVQNMNKHITCDEKAVEANGSQDGHDGNEEVEPFIILLDRGSAELLPKEEPMNMERALPTRAGVEERGQNQWMKMEGGHVKNDQEEESSEDSDEGLSSSSDVEVIKEVTFEGKKLVDSIELSGDSEEEETVVLNAADVNISGKDAEGSGTSEKNRRNWYPSKEW